MGEAKAIPATPAGIAETVKDIGHVLFGESEHFDQTAEEDDHKEQEFFHGKID